MGEKENKKEKEDTFAGECTLVGRDGGRDCERELERLAGRSQAQMEGVRPLICRPRTR